jgi:hypothetical protein
MADQDWVSLFPQGDQIPWSGPGTALSTAATATISPLPSGVTADFNKYINAADWRVGKIIRVTARGFITTTASAGTLTFFLGTNIDNAGTTYVTLATTAAIATPASAITGLQWELTANSRVTAVASSGNTISTQGLFKCATTLTPTIATASGITAGMPNASGETAAAVNTLRTQGFALRCTQATSLCTVQCTHWFLELMN